MKFVLIILFSSIIGLAVNADDTPTAQTTQADWFSPSCPSCGKLLTPGSANLGNSKGVFKPADKKKKKLLPETQPVDTGL